LQKRQGLKRQELKQERTKKEKEKTEKGKKGLKKEKEIITRLENDTIRPKVPH
jgi:hypothetical protein